MWLSTRTLTACLLAAVLLETVGCAGLGGDDHAESQTCSSTQVKISVRQYYFVKSPVPVTIAARKPSGCEPTYSISIDGRPYDQRLSDPTKPPSNSNRRVAQPLETKSPSASCVSAATNWLSIPLPPGTHKLVVRGCARGTASPRTMPTSKRFTVLGGPAKEKCGDIELVAGYPQVAVNIKVGGVDCATAQDFIRAYASDCGEGECNEGGYACFSPYQGTGSVYLICIHESRRIEWVFGGAS